jgi:DNA-binding response OmpR family regulator
LLARDEVTYENTNVFSGRIGRALLISPFDEDRRDLHEILRHSDWRQHEARTKLEAFDFLRDNPTPVVICESELPDGTWKDVLAQLALLKYPPMLVVTSRLADERLWSEVLNLGGYNVLAKPLNAREVMHVVGLAGLLWKSQWGQLQECARSAEPTSTWPA